METEFIFYYLLAFVLMALCVMIVYEYVAFAEGDWFKAVDIRVYDTPDVCIFEPNYDIQYFNEIMFPYVYDGIKQWERNLSLATGGDWYIRTHLYANEYHDEKSVNDFRQCNIIVTFEETNDGKRVGRDALGFTYFDHSWSAHKYSHVVIFTHVYNNKISVSSNQTDNGVTVRILPTKLDLSDIQHITKHEIGHAFGILHHYNADESDDIRSVMHPTFKSFSNHQMDIQPRDVGAMVHMYGEDGFLHPNPIFISKEFAIFEYFIPGIIIEDVRVIVE